MIMSMYEREHPSRAAAAADPPAPSTTAENRSRGSWRRISALLAGHAVGAIAVFAVALELDPVRGALPQHPPAPIVDGELGERLRVGREHRARALVQHVDEVSEALAVGRFWR